MTWDSQITVGNLLTMFIIITGMVSGFIKISDRLTKVETTLELLLKHYVILNGKIEN